MIVDGKSAGSTSNELSEAELRDVLDMAERRKESELSRTSRMATLVIGVPIAALILWGGIFLIQYRVSENKTRAAKTIAAAPVAPPQAPQDLAELDAFLPGEKSAKGTPGDGNIVHHEDIRFAMELLNFGRSPSAGKEEKDKKD